MKLFPEAMVDLIRDGRQRHPEVTGRFMQAMEEHRGWDLDAQVATLPPACRTQAEQIVAQGRRMDLSNEQIAHAICEAERTSYEHPAPSSAHTGAEYAAWLDANGFVTGFPS